MRLISGGIVAVKNNLPRERHQLADAFDVGDEAMSSMRSASSMTGD